MRPLPFSPWLALVLAALPAAAFAQAVPPSLEGFVAAEYPPAALAAGVEGEVVLALTVEASGAVSDAKVATPGGFGFDEAALAAARRFTFKPATKDGQPVRAQILYRYRFSLGPRDKQANPLAAPLDPGDGRPPTGALGAADLLEILPPGAIEGAVTERGSRVPVPFAQVFVIDPGTGAVSREATADEAGRFTLRGLLPGRRRLRVAADGYEPLTSEETIPETGALSLTLRLLPTADPGYGLVIRGEKGEEEVTRHVISAEELSKLPGSKGDILKGIQNLPGMARAPFGIGLLIVRGSAPEDTQVFLDGLPIPIIYHFGGLTSVISEDILSSLSFIPGVYSARYGRGMGGVIDVETDLGAPKRVTGAIDTDVFDTGASLKGPLPRGDMKFAVAARRSYIDVPLSLVEAAGAELGLSVAPHYWDYQAAISAPLFGGRGQLIAFGSQDRFELADPEATDDFFFSLSSRFHRLQASWKKEIAPGLSRRASASLGITESNFLTPPEFEFRLRDYLGAARLDWASELSKRLALTYGADVQLHRLSLDSDAEGLPPPNENSTRLRGDIALYAEGRVTPVDGLTIAPGLRVDRLGVSEAFTVDPRLALRWDVDLKTALKAGAGLFHQDPKAQDFLAPESPAPHPQYSSQVTLGVERRLLRDRLDLDASVYYKHLYRQIVRGLTFGELPAEILTDEGFGRVAGLEVLLRHPPGGRFFGWVAYSLARAERKDSAEGEWRLFDFDQAHSLTLLGSYKLSRDVTVGGRFRLISGHPYTAVDRGIYDSDLDFYFPVIGDQNGARLPPFHQLDLRVDKKYRKKTWSLTLYLEVTNAYNRRNPEFEPSYNFDFTKTQFPGGLPIIPVIGAEGEF